MIACEELKRHMTIEWLCQITFPRLYCPFSWSQSRTRKTETDRFQTHIFSSGARKEPEKGRHFLPIIFRFLCKNDRLRDPGMQKTMWLLPGKELCRSAPVLLLNSYNAAKFY